MWTTPTIVKITGSDHREYKLSVDNYMGLPICVMLPNGIHHLTKDGLVHSYDCPSHSPNTFKRPPKPINLGSAVRLAELIVDSQQFPWVETNFTGICEPFSRTQLKDICKKLNIHITSSPRVVILGKIKDSSKKRAATKLLPWASVKDMFMELDQLLKEL